MENVLHPDAIAEAMNVALGAIAPFDDVPARVTEPIHVTDPHGALLMGAIAFSVLMFAEFATAVLCFHRTAAEYVAGFWSVPGAIGLAAQACFAGFPFVQSNRHGIDVDGSI